MKKIYMGLAPGLMLALLVVLPSPSVAARYETNCVSVKEFNKIPFGITPFQAKRYVEAKATKDRKYRKKVPSGYMKKRIITFDSCFGQAKRDTQFNFKVVNGKNVRLFKKTVKQRWGNRQPTPATPTPTPTPAPEEPTYGPGGNPDPGPNPWAPPAPGNNYAGCSNDLAWDGDTVSTGDTVDVLEWFRLGDANRSMTMWQVEKMVGAKVVGVTDNRKWILRPEGYSASSGGHVYVQYVEDQQKRRTLHRGTEWVRDWTPADTTGTVTAAEYEGVTVGDTKAAAEATMAATGHPVQATVPTYWVFPSDYYSLFYTEAYRTSAGKVEIQYRSDDCGKTWVVNAKSA